MGVGGPREGLSCQLILWVVELGPRDLGIALGATTLQCTVCTQAINLLATHQLWVALRNPLALSTLSFLIYEMGSCYHICLP